MFATWWNLEQKTQFIDDSSSSTLPMVEYSYLLIEQLIAGWPSNYIPSIPQQLFVAAI